MLRFKKGVSIYGLQPEMLWCLDCCVEVWIGDCTVTSARYKDSHKRASLHYVGHAVDLRTRDLNQQQVGEIVAALSLVLGDPFDICQEDTHLHIEYQPKAATNYPTAMIH